MSFFYLSEIKKEMKNEKNQHLWFWNSSPFELIDYTELIENLKKKYFSFDF